MIHFELVTLNGTKYASEVHEVLLPTPAGQIAVFANHAPIVSIASPGIIRVRVKANDPDDFMEAYATQGGVIEIADEAVRVLVDEADASDEINEAEAAKAKTQAQQLLKDARDQVSLDQAQALLDRSDVRLRVAELKTRRRKHR